MAQTVIVKDTLLAEMVTTSGTNHIDYVGIVWTAEDPVGSGDYSYSTIDSIKAITWAGDGIATADVDFTVPAGRVVTGLFLYDSTSKADASLAIGDEVIRYFFNTSTTTSTGYGFVNEGTLRLSNLAITF